MTTSIWIKATPSSLQSRRTYLLHGYLPQAKLILAWPVPQRSNCKQYEKNGTEQHFSSSLPFQQFQVLFNSLFKVLCIFPSRYLFAIGLPPIFSFGWNLPPALSCNPKQLDSSNTLLIPCQTGVSPSMLPYSKGLRLGLLSNEFISTTRRKVT